MLWHSPVILAFGIRSKKITSSRPAWALGLNSIKKGKHGRIWATENNPYKKRTMSLNWGKREKHYILWEKRTHLEPHRIDNQSLTLRGFFNNLFIYFYSLTLRFLRLQIRNFKIRKQSMKHRSSRIIGPCKEITVRQTFTTEKPELRGQTLWCRHPHLHTVSHEK